MTLLRLTEVETLGMRTAYFAVLHRRFRDIVFQPNPGIPADCRMFSVSYYVISPSFLSAHGPKLTEGKLTETGYPGEEESG